MLSIRDKLKSAVAMITVNQFVYINAVKYLFYFYVIYFFRIYWKTLGQFGKYTE